MLSQLKTKAELKGEFFETNLYTVQTNAKGGSYKVVAKMHLMELELLVKMEK